MMIWLYAQLLRLYPARFKALFADEMLDVFVMAQADARQSGSTTWFYLREVAELPLSIVIEHVRDGRHAKNVPMSDTATARRIVRAVAFGFAFFMVYTSAIALVNATPQGYMNALLYLTYHAIMLGALLFTLRWEQMGGLIVIVSATTLSCIACLGFATTPGLFWVALISTLIWMLPYVPCGLLFIALGRLSQRQHQEEAHA